MEFSDLKNSLGNPILLLEPVTPATSLTIIQWHGWSVLELKSEFVGSLC